MALVLELRDQAGGIVASAGEAPPDKLLPIPTADDDRFPLLRGIDPYGDTTFSSHQAVWLADELETLLGNERHPARQQMIRDAAALARECAARPHSALVFIGD